MKKQDKPTPVGNDFNELIVDKRTDEVIKPGTKEYREAFHELYGRYPEDRPQYEARIKNVSINKWVSDDSVFTPKINLGYAVNENRALVFWDEAEANSILELLNDSLDYCFTLIE